MSEIIETNAAILKERHADFTIEPIRLGPLRADEVLVRIVATGMCHTDLMVREGVLPTPVPVILGHEGAGIVSAVGDDVDDLAPGDHVVLTYLSCQQCPECLRGEPASCAMTGPLCFGGARLDGSHAAHSHDGSELNDRFFGQSSFAGYAVAHKSNAIKVRSDAPLELLGPLGCGIMTGAGAVWKSLGVEAGATFAVYGAGAVGLSAVMAAKVAGAARIIAIDRVDGRLQLASSLGATDTINSAEQDALSVIRSLTDGGVDYVLDTTGRHAVIKLAVESLRQTGAAAIVAVAEQGDLPLNGLDLLVGCKSIRGVIEGGGSAQELIPKMVELYMEGRFPFDRLIKIFAFDQINEAARAGLSGEVVKPVLAQSAQA